MVSKFVKILINRYLCFIIKTGMAFELNYSNNLIKIKTERLQFTVNRINIEFEE